MPRIRKVHVALALGALILVVGAWCVYLNWSFRTMVAESNTFWQAAGAGARLSDELWLAESVRTQAIIDSLPAKQEREHAIFWRHRALIEVHFSNGLGSNEATSFFAKTQAVLDEVVKEAVGTPELALLKQEQACVATEAAFNLLNLDRQEEALAALYKALELMQDSSAPGTKEAMQLRFILAEACRKQAEKLAGEALQAEGESRTRIFEKALALVDKAQAVASRHNNDYDQLVRHHLLLDSGAFRWWLRRHDEALKDFTEALDLGEMLFNENPARILDILKHLIALNKEMGRAEAVEHYRERARQIEEALRSPPQKQQQIPADGPPPVGLPI
jgi:tetratricopeptide (TPR) repeat protein